MSLPKSLICKPISQASAEADRRNTRAHRQSRAACVFAALLIGVVAHGYAQNADHAADHAVAAGGSVMTIILPEDQETQLALSAGPEHVREAAAVYVFGRDGYRLTRAGTNGFTCLVNRDGNQSRDHDLKPTCWDPEGSRTIVPVMLRVGELLAKASTAEQIRRDIDQGFSTGRFTSPRKAGIAYMLVGDVSFDPVTKQVDKPVFPPHYMMYAPGVSNADIGTDASPGKGDPQLPMVYSGYSGGSRTAYIIIMAKPR